MAATALDPRHSRPKRLHVITWGCQMNVYDSTRMTDVLSGIGYAPVDTPEDADMVILNTCHIREKAAEKVFSELGRLRRLKEAKARAGSRMILAVAGCVAQAEGQEIIARSPFVDIVLGPQTYHRLPELIARAVGGQPVVDTEFPPEDKFDNLPESAAPQGVTVFLAVQEGCDKFCSFCVVPYTRGAEQSRPAAAVLAEARRLVARGAREITLLGQNVNAWHGEGLDGSTWALSSPDPRLGGHPWGRTAAVHHLPSQGYGPGPDYGAPGCASFDAFPAPSGAIRLGSGLGRNEPPPPRR